MAKANRKTSTAPANAKRKLTLVASPVAAFKATVIPVLQGVATAKDQAHGLSVKARDVILTGLVTLRSALPDFVAYTGAVVELLGNGEKGKAHKAGCLIDAIPDAQRLSMRVTLSEARKIARWLEDPKHLASAPGMNFAKIVAEVKPAKVVKAGKIDKSATAPGEVTSLEQLIARDVVGAMRIIAKILNVNKATKTQAAACAALAMQIE